MGLERFEVGKHFQPIYKSLGICEGFCFWAKKTLLFFSEPAIEPYKNCLLANKDLSIGFHLPKLNIWGQNPYAHKTI